MSVQCQAVGWVMGKTPDYETMKCGPRGKRELLSVGSSLAGKTGVHTRTRPRDSVNTVT